MNLENQIILITGGSSGLGKACAEYLSQQGGKIIIWDKYIEPINFAISVKCDVVSETDVNNAMDESIEKLGIPSVCINCAGIAPARRIVDKNGAMPLEEFKTVIDINLIGTFNVMRIFAQALINQDISRQNDDNERGVIINTASIAAYEGQIGQSAYSASKGAIVALTLPAAREFANFGIRVNTIAPGIFATPLLLKMPQDLQDGLASTIPFPKRLGKPQEFAQLARQIIENPMINGEVIRLDGALRMQPKPF